METKLIYQKIIAILQDVDAIGKNKTNPQQGYKFRGIDDMYNALHPLFNKNGVFITSEVVKAEREERVTAKGGVLLYSIVDVKFTFHAQDGSSVSSTLKGEAMDSGDKATNKAISAALKYALMQMFLIPTEEKIDTEYYSPEVRVKDDTIALRQKYSQLVLSNTHAFSDGEMDTFLKGHESWNADKLTKAIEKLTKLIKDREDEMEYQRMNPAAK